MKKLSTIALIACVALMSACGPKDPGLKDAYKGYFKIGVAVTPRNVTDSLQAAIILKEFNSIGLCKVPYTRLGMNLTRLHAVLSCDAVELLKDDGCLK